MSPEHFRFGTVGSPISTPKKPGGSVGAIQRSRELGLDALELGWVNSVRVSEKTCQEIQKNGQENQVAVSVHAPYYINLNASDEEWPKARKRLMDAAHYGFLAGATDIVFHPGSYFGLSAQDVLPKTITRLEACLQELRAAGKTVILRPETMGKPAMIGSLEDTLVMSQAIEGVEPCLDFAHLHARVGDGSMNKYEKWVECLDQYAKALGKDALQRLHIHLSGIEYGQKGERNHLPLDKADIDFIAIFRALKEFGCKGRILCESPIMEDDALKMQKAWRELV
jgi:deoxyribonuclease-4